MLLSDLKSPLSTNELLKYTQYLVVAGSHAYGTAVENSDLDVRGWYFPSISDLLGIYQKSRDSITYSESDTVLYTFHKFVHLLSQCNPNVVEQMGVDKKCILYQSLPSQILQDNLELFLSKRAFYTFGGYANTMLKRFEQGNSVGWRNHKKEESKQWKHLMHLIRLYYMGIDILKKHQVITHRVEEHDLLMSIRYGEVDIGYVFSLREKLEIELQHAYDSTLLPEQAQMTQINNLVFDITRDYIKNPDDYVTKWNNWS